MNNIGFVTPPVALELKRLGFSERVWTFYQDNGIAVYCSGRLVDYNEFPDCLSAATWTEASYWLWTEHKIHISLAPNGFSIISEMNLNGEVEFESYEECFLTAMKNLK